MLTQDLLKELFDYDPDTGDLIAKVAAQSRPIGKILGAKSNGYLTCYVSGKNHQIHRLIWLWVYGEIPRGMHIDHINGVRDDNRLHNLRLATQAANNANKKMSRNNTTGFKGVYLRSSGKFEAIISINSKLKSLGMHETDVEAAEAYDRAAIETYGQFAKTNKVLGNYDK